MKVLVLILIAGAGAAAQVLSLSDATVAAGQEVTLQLKFDPEGKEPPAAIQWDLVYPAGWSVSVEPPAVADSRKLSCAPHKNRTEREEKQACLLAGSTKPVQSGVIGRFRVRVPQQTKRGRYLVRIGNGKGATAALKEVVVHDNHGIVTVR